VLDRSDSIARTIISILVFFISGIVIGIITLIGSAIGLMNIMLVQFLNEQERLDYKAIGGKKKLVRRQFLIESVLISLMGAFWGIIWYCMQVNLIALSLGTRLCHSVELGDHWV
jgi:putative ABC transport system permease protein